MKNKILKKYKNEGLVMPATYDVVFKAVMQDESCKEYLIEIIHGLTKMEKRYIRDNMVIKNSEIPIKNTKEKRKITDLVIYIKENIINIEMNNRYYKGLIERNDIYLNELRNLKIGKKYIDIPKIIQIDFDNFDKYKEDTIMKFVIMDEKTHVKETENYEKYHINLKRIRKKYYNKEKLTDIEKKFLILTLDKKEDLINICRGDYVMEKVGDKIIELSEEAAAILCYDEKEHERKEIEAEIETRKEEAREEGLAEGKREGMKEGMKEGIKEGKIEVARKILKQGIDINIIASCTGLSIDEIIDLDK